MRSTVALLALVTWLSTSGVASAARDEYEDSQSHPLRVAAYLVHPVGFVLEWVIFRPLHAVVSASPETEKVFGHTPHGTDEINARPTMASTVGRY